MWRLWIFGSVLWWQGCGLLPASQGNKGHGLAPSFGSTQPSYEALAQRCIDSLDTTSRLWIGIAGGPGAGKSTVAEAVQEFLERDFGVPTAVLPMDGFHYSRTQLRELDPPDASHLLKVRGAPQTFDAESFVEAMAAAKRDGQASLPAYSRELSDPIEDVISLNNSHRVVLVEGNYLFLGFLETDEGGRWRDLCDLFDQRWFVRARGGVGVRDVLEPTRTSTQEQRRRLVMRHLQTWTEAKTRSVGGLCCLAFDIASAGLGMVSRALSAAARREIVRSRDRPGGSRKTHGFQRRAQRPSR